MTSFFNLILFRPLFNTMVFIYDLIPGHDFGVAIIVLTLIIRIIFFPLSIRSLKSQKEMAELNPKIKELKEKYKNDKVKQNQATMDLYKSHNINPLAGCLPLLIQLPILIALYQVFIVGLSPQSLFALYSFVPRPETLNPLFLGILDITKRNLPLVFTAGILQFLQAKQNIKIMKLNSGTGNEMAALNTQMLYFFPLFIIIAGWKLQAGLVLYWIATTLFSIIEQTYLRRTYGQSKS